MSKVIGLQTASIQKTKTVWKPFILSLIATPFCLLLALASAGAGHGDYFWAKIFYPYTMLSTLLLNSITMPFSVLAIAQMAIYGGLLSLAATKNRLGFAALGLLTIHSVAAIACFVVRLENFS